MTVQLIRCQFCPNLALYKKGPAAFLVINDTIRQAAPFGLVLAAIHNTSWNGLLNNLYFSQGWDMLWTEFSKKTLKKRLVPI